MPHFHLKPLSDTVFAAGQAPRDIMSDLAGAGVLVIVNHRPNGEEPGQPENAELEAEAQAAGLTWFHIPVRGMPDAAAVEATARALESVPPGGKALLFCRSGMRSTAAWAMTEAARGVDPDELRAAAAEAGYDLSRLPL